MARAEPSFRAIGEAPVADRKDKSIVLPPGRPNEFFNGQE
jgi:hypothetical protein